MAFQHLALASPAICQCVPFAAVPSPARVALQHSSSLCASSGNYIAQDLKTVKPAAVARSGVVQQVGHQVSFQIVDVGSVGT